MAECAQHPGVPAAGECSRCSRTLCADCLVEVQGRVLCAACKAVLLHALQPGAVHPRPRVIFWVLAYDAALLLGALLTSAVQIVFYTMLSGTHTYIMDAQMNGISIPMPPVDLLWIHVVVGIIGVLVALLPMVLLWLRRSSAYFAQLAVLVAGPLLALVWAWEPWMTLPYWIAAAVLIARWMCPDLRAYCREETP